MRPPGPRRLRRLGIASSPLKLREIQRPHEPKPFGPAVIHLHLLRGHAGDSPTAYLLGGLLMPQATEKAQNASDQWLAATSSAIAYDAAARPLHRVVPGARPHGVGTPPRDDWILQGRRGAQPTRVARRPGPFAQATRAAWIYIAMLTQPASLPAPRHCFSPSAPHEWPSIGALADRRCPATISICVAIRVEAARSGSYSGYLDLVALLEAWNASDQWLAATSSAIAYDAAARPLHRVVPGARPHGVGTPPRDDWILQGRRGAQPTRVARRPGPFAQATRAAWIYIAMLTQPASLPAPRHCFSPSAPHEWPSIGALADRRCPATISICVAIRVEAARPGSYSGYLDLVASLEAWNGPDQWLATTGLSTPQGFIASPLHRVVRRDASYAFGPSSNARSVP